MQHQIEMLRTQIQAARRRMLGVARTTPLLECASLNEAAQARVLIKAESLQVTGSFKLRGAYNAMVTSGDVPGYVAWSTGNAGLGAAHAARLLGRPLTVVMPVTAAVIKLTAVRDAGANVVLYDPATEDGEARAREIADMSGRYFVHPFDDDRVIAGNATVGVEIVEQIGHEPDAMIVPCGGGGLLAGISAATTQRRSLQCIGIEPASLSDNQAPTICDALTARSRSHLARTYCDTMSVRREPVDDRMVQTAMRFAFKHFNLVLEPSGAAALAFLLSRGHEFHHQVVVVVATGANVDPDVFASALRHGTPR